MEKAAENSTVPIRNKNTDNTYDFIQRIRNLVVPKGTARYPFTKQETKMKRNDLTRKAEKGFLAQVGEKMRNWIRSRWGWAFSGLHNLYF